ncbi:hypothetical protein F4803DRAFT_514759 [Xylaria telfairii]|nr:hypothetical protein F4803DRAFT_514759 [Xylaria telfairii]
MPFKPSISNRDSGAQNVALGWGPQFNLNGPGTQNNFFGLLYTPFSNSHPTEETFRKGKERCLASLSFRRMNSR